MMAQGFTRAYRLSVLNHQNICNLGHHSSRSVSVRHKSGYSRSETGDFPQLIEVDLEPGNGVEYFSVKRLEEAIHRIIVRRAAPDWLPFLPGASYWVPPPSSSRRIIDFVARSSNPMTDEETLSFSTSRGWPSTAYYIEGCALGILERTLHEQAVPSVRWKVYFSNRCISSSSGGRYRKQRKFRRRLNPYLLCLTAEKL